MFSLSVPCRQEKSTAILSHKAIDDVAPETSMDIVICPKIPNQKKFPNLPENYKKK